MKPTEFSEANVMWTGQGNVGDLASWRSEEDGEISISCWKVGWWERIRLLRTGRVWLHVWTLDHPPVYMSADYPWYEDEEGETE